ncbi:hypothetical protein FQN60_015546 [Etheostoma spectabile]|uniref:G-protein coupled receptors family 2 profile 2 domain-containing protein n=1 Tax=Etheostoma spectabile TaxID=54343 RepID=A0A5J5CRE1_9PERO|nr:hypothetical protein FQN60_015546 [Etheostoma spectabile]
MNVTIQTEDGGNFNAAEAAGIMNKMADLAKAMNESSAALTVAEGVTGILVKTEEAEPADIREVSIAYSSPNDNMNIIGDKDTLATFSRSVTVSKEALTKCSLENGTAFSAVLRFLNLTSDEKNSTVLGNEVIAVEMGTTITNLTDKMKINFLNMKYKGIPSCHSWNGEGSRPNWTDDGCQTKFDERNIFCECSHLTFFAILMTPLNETISSSDLNNLTIITQVGCGLSIFFLSIVLFMHFLLRKTKASNTTTILIHLVSAMSLLNFAFLINSYVANLKSSVICKIMAALMHYFMLATFTWFAVQAFHLCLQLYAGGQIVIRHYILKVSIVSWVLPSVVGIVLLILGKYGEQLIHTNDSDQTVAMCWITDNLVHYVVNIGYYVSVFIFTFTTFILILSRLFFLKKANTNQKSTNGKSIVIILGLCCMLGITWGFAFFAYGALRIPSYYIFTVLNSFQGFFLFIYYYNTSSGDITGGASNHKNSNSVNTIKTSLDSFENPYTSPPKGLKSNEKLKMEPLDPAKNDEGSGFTRRRISSILKAPQRSSMKFSDPVQQENVVECAKPVEKRNSRRVSFAPANNVLLFSKDGKNASPAKNPLQELIMTTAAATNNRVQVALTEDGIQPITGMETLLNAPLHASQQGHKVNFDTVGGLGEKTVMFSTNDEFMDMTHSHTINIAGDAELLGDISLQNYDPLPSRREKTAMFSVNNGSMARNVSSSVPSLDTEFENFLDSHSKQSSPSPSLVVTRTKHAPVAPSEEANRSLAQIKTQRADVDKENQAPTSVSAVMEKSLNPSKKIGELSYRSALCPEDDISMDMTEPEADCMLGFTDDDDDPFQCLFPTQEMYSRFDNRVLQTAEKTKQQKSSKTLASFNPKDMTSLKNPAVHASHRRHKANCDTENDCKEKTIMFSAGDEFMNMTQSHTVNIASSLLPPPNQNLDIVHTLGKMDNASSLEERKHEAGGAPGLSANAMDLGFEDFLSSLSKPGASSGNPAIARAIPSAAASSKETVDINSSLFQLRSNVCKVSQSLITSRSVEKSFNGSTISPENDVSTYMTKVQTDRIIGPTASDDPFRCHFPTQEMYSRCEGLKKQEMTSGQKNSEALGSSNCAGMETALKPSLKTKVERNPVKFDTEDDCREKPERFSACMDGNVDCLPACGERTMRFNTTDAAMDVTQSHTVNIATGFELQSFQNVDRLAISGEKTFKFTANNTSMDKSQCLTVNIAGLGLPVRNKKMRHVVCLETGLHQHAVWIQALIRASQNQVGPVLILWSKG